MPYAHVLFAFICCIFRYHNLWWINSSREGTVRHCQSKQASILWSHHEETRELPGERDNARDNARCTQAKKTTHCLFNPCTRQLCMCFVWFDFTIVLYYPTLLFTTGYFYISTNINVRLCRHGYNVVCDTIKLAISLLTVEKFAQDAATGLCQLYRPTNSYIMLSATVHAVCRCWKPCNGALRPTSKFSILSSVQKLP